MTETNQSVLTQIESKAIRIYEINRQAALGEEDKQRLKESIAILMKQNNMENYLFRLDDTSDLKIAVGERSTTKLDKEELANDLGISIDSAGKKDVLIKKTEEGVLSYSRFKQYEYQETAETVAIRKVNA